MFIIYNKSWPSCPLKRRTVSHWITKYKKKQKIQVQRGPIANTVKYKERQETAERNIEFEINAKKSKESFI